MTPKESEALKMLANAAKILGWNIVLHFDDNDELNVAAITIGKMALLETLGKEIFEQSPIIH